MKRIATYVPAVESRSTTHAIRGVRYHVTEWGDPSAPLLVLLHGWGDCGATFQFFVDALQQDRHVIAPDWRGFGRSRCRATGYWFPDYVADLHALLGVYSPGQPVALLGHSMGGNAGGLYAGVFPERVQSFVNVEGFGLADSDPGNAPQHYRRWIEKSRTLPAYRRYASFAELAARIAERNPHMSADRAAFVARQWAVRGRDGGVVLRADPAHKLPNAVQYRRAEAEACWAAVTSPVLLVSGAETEFKSYLEHWLEPASGPPPFRAAERAVVPDAGHMLHFEQPGRLAAVVEAFLGKAASHR